MYIWFFIEYGYYMSKRQPDCIACMVGLQRSNTNSFELFRTFLFSRVLPNLKRIGLLTDEVRPKFEALGLLEYEHAPDDFECDWAEMRKPLEKFGQIPTSL